jgi:hypothetical protein
MRYRCCRLYYGISRVVGRISNVLILVRCVLGEGRSHVKHITVTSVVAQRPTSPNARPRPDMGSISKAIEAMRLRISR